MKNSIILIFIGCLFAQEANLSFGEVSLANSTIEVILTNDMPVSGFQFEVNTDSLISVESATGGSAENYGFTIDIGTNNDILLGYSTSFSEIPSGEEILTILHYTGFGNSTLCISNALIVNGYEELTELNTTYGDCITLNYILGDVNLDESINVNDIVIMVSFILENAYPTEYESWASDLSEDGEINISDIVMAIYCIFNECNEEIEPPDPGECTDIDGNSYETVEIGDQLWMAENLKVTHYNNGDAIQYIQSESSEPNVWENLSTGAYCYYDDNLSYHEIYGNLYNWYTVDDERGVCPEGWHVPTDEEWTVLTDYLGGTSVAGGKMKETGLEHWNSPNSGATNESGFTALPSGYRYYNNGYYNNIGYLGYFWSSSELNSFNAWGRVLSYSYANVYRFSDYKPYGFSVRCVRN